MPACFQLTPKGSSTPAKFVDIDKEMCEHLGVPCDPGQWYAHWYDIIGLALAVGKDWEWLREQYGEDEELGPVVEFLAERYDAESWTER